MHTWLDLSPVSTSTMSAYGVPATDDDAFITLEFSDDESSAAVKVELCAFAAKEGTEKQRQRREAVLVEWCAAHVPERQHDRVHRGCCAHRYAILR